MVPQYQHLFIELFKKEKEAVRKSYKLNQVVSEKQTEDSAPEDSKITMHRRASLILSGFFKKANKQQHFFEEMASEKEEVESMASLN